MRSPYSLILLVALTACSQNPVVEIPVPVPCVDALPPPPEKCVPADTSRQEWLRCILIDYAELQAYDKEVTALLSGCLDKGVVP